MVRKNGRKGFLLTVFVLVLSISVGVAAQTEGTVILIDHLGREVQIQHPIQRPVALTANLMEALYIIGLKPVATVNNYQIREEAQGLPRLGMQANINIEMIYAVEPDLILVHSRHQGQLVPALENTGFPVYVVNPAQVGDAPLYDTALFVGRLLGREEEVLSFVSEVETTARQWKDRIRVETNIRTGLIIEDGDSIQAAQTGSGLGAILTGLGIINIVPDDMPGSSQDTFISFDIETILAADPDIILIRPTSNDEQHNAHRLTSYLENPLWVGLTAIQTGRVRMLPFRAHPGRATVPEMYEMAARIILE